MLYWKDWLLKPEKTNKCAEPTQKWKEQEAKTLKILYWKDWLFKPAKKPQTSVLSPTQTLKEQETNIENVMLVGLVTQTTQTSVWMVQHTTESRLVHTYIGTSLGYLDSVVC